MTGDTTGTLALAWSAMTHKERYKTVIKPGFFPDNVVFKEPSCYKGWELNLIFDTMHNNIKAGNNTIEFMVIPPTNKQAGTTGPPQKNKKKKESYCILRDFFFFSVY